MTKETLQKEARIKLSNQGIFAPWYLRASQLDIYELLHRDKNPFIEASRRFGKTTSVAIFVHELLLANPGWICRWCAPDQKQARTIVKPIFSQIQKYTSTENRAHWRTTDSHYIYPNGSILYLIGVNQDKGESARGPAANIIVLDEYGFWVEAEYIAKSILFPQLQNQQGQWFIKTSTPPPDLSHIYYIEKDVAQRKDRFIQKLIWDNEALSKDELEKIIEEAGGRDSVTFRREYLCEAISDPKRLIVKEFEESRNTVDNSYNVPSFFTTYVSGDSGFDDNTAMLFGYYDFLKDEIIIQKEFVTNGETTRSIIEKAKQIELSLWPENKPHKRAYDTNKQSMFDIYVDLNYQIQIPPKDDKHAAIHELRVLMGQGKIKINKSCSQLIQQVKIGMWKDERHTDFERNETLGHLDALAALVYFVRIVDKSLNPYPPAYGLNPEKQFIPATISAELTSQAEEVFLDIFRR